MEQTVQASFKQQTIPTYKTGEPMDLPFFFEKKPYQGASGKLYPLSFTDTLTGEKVDKQYQVGVLENQYIRIEVLPEIGGKISRGFDKVGDSDFIYHNSVVKPALIGLAGPWVSGGIEFNWPQHHRPSTFLPLPAAFEHNEDGSATLWTGEVDAMLHMKGMAGITVCPGRSYCKVKVRIFNRTEFVQPFMWWANLAVPGKDQYRIVFPPDVEYANDHDRRAVIGWPIAKGVYETARPFDYGTGTDLSYYSSIKVPTSYMVSEGQSEMDFVSGYDEATQMGIVSWADHRIAPGKKLFHWGDGDFGRMWCSNLTDTDGPYVELMTGCYTDNQPDFSWILPGETKEFEQYWYPIRSIGAVKNATKDAALNMERRDGALFLGVHATASFPSSSVVVFHAGEVVWKTLVDLDPETPWVCSLPWKAKWSYEKLSVEVRSAQGRGIVAFTVPIRGQKEPIKPRKPIRRPSEFTSIEELYLAGIHLEQYKQHSYDPSDYYQEALKRDPEDIRCNTSMGRLCLKRGLYEDCLSYCTKAIERLLSLNGHPVLVEALYLKALSLVRLHRDGEAKVLFSKVIWNFEYKEAAYYELACLSCREGLLEEALENLAACGVNNLKARNLKAAVLRHLTRLEESRVLGDSSLTEDLLDLSSRFEKFLFTQDPEIIGELKQVFGPDIQGSFDVVCEYMHAGFFDDALQVLNCLNGQYPLVPYYKAYLSKCLSRPYAAFFQQPVEGICFPSRLEDCTVLQWVVTEAPDPSQANYLLGCLLYDKERYGEAMACWEATIAINSNHAQALRNLALGYYDKCDDARGARLCMEKAFSLSHNPRIFFEYQQLLKQSNVDDLTRLSLYEQYPQLVAQRDDLYLDRILLLTAQKRYGEAIKLISSRTFHIYEGGEGKLTKHHSWLYVLYALSLEEKGDYEKASQAYFKALLIPKEYGEAKSWFAQEGHVYYFLGRMLALTKASSQEVLKAYGQASIPKSAVSEISLFRALSLQQLGQFSQARKVLQEMLDQGQNLIDNADRYPYFGVGAVTPMPFGYDIQKTNRIEGNILKAYALLGLGKRQQALEALSEVKASSPYEFRVFVFETILGLIE
jgi:tetratricopeptide (TPR) repeat protein